MEMVNAAIQVMAYLALGYLCIKVKWCGPGAVKTLTNIVVNIALPGLIIDSMMVPFETEKLTHGLLSVLMVVLILAVCGLCGIGWSKLLKPGDKQHQAVLQMALMYNNFMLVGVPIIEASLGTEGVFYTGLMGLPQRATIFIMLPIVYGRVAEGAAADTHHFNYDRHVPLCYTNTAALCGKRQSGRAGRHGNASGHDAGRYAAG